MPEEEKKNEDKVVLAVHMHCEACREKVRKAIIGYPGVEHIDIDMKAQKVTVKGKIDAKKFFERVKKKSGKAEKILYPEQKKDGDKKDKEENKKEEKKKEPPDVTVVLKVQMHCGACKKKVDKCAWGIKGASEVKFEGDKLTIKGKELEAKKVCEEIMKKSGKHAEVVPPKKEEKKDEKKEEKKEEKKGDEAKKDESKATKATTEYVYAPQYFSDENPNSCVVM